MCLCDHIAAQYLDKVRILSLLTFKICENPHMRKFLFHLLVLDIPELSGYGHDEYLWKTF